MHLQHLDRVMLQAADQGNTASGDNITINELNLVSDEIASRVGSRDNEIVVKMIGATKRATLSLLGQELGSQPFSLRLVWSGAQLFA